MKIAVVGGGIAGLGAAFELREKGHDVVLLEKESEPGGRCRSLNWHNQWIVRGAFAFIGSETSLVDLSRKLGIYSDEDVVDLTPWHRWNVLVRRKETAYFKEFNLLDAAKHPYIPLAEKARLLATLPTLAKSMLTADPDDITSVVAYDNVDACDYFRQYSPTFVDYFLEPCISLFCGYAPGDFSLAWLLWGASGRHAWANHWWSFRERGVGRLTWELGERLAADDGTDYRLGHTVEAVHVRNDGVHVECRAAEGMQETVRVDAIIMATPGTKVSGLMPDLDAQRRLFFEKVAYAGHHIAYFLIDRGAMELPRNHVLPLADGFDRTANFSFTDLGNGRTLAFSEWKDTGCKRHAACTAAELLDIAWSDFVDVIPTLSKARLLDRFVSRQDEAIAKRPVGYITAVKRFRALGPLRNVTFCGDYLANSTVGSAHQSGLRAARELLGQTA